MSVPEIGFILGLAYIVVGPKKIPELARKLGKLTAEFTRAKQQFQQQIQMEISELEAQSKEVLEAPNTIRASFNNHSSYNYPSSSDSVNNISSSNSYADYGGSSSLNGGHALTDSESPVRSSDDQAIAVHATVARDSSFDSINSD